MYTVVNTCSYFCYPRCCIWRDKLPSISPCQYNLPRLCSRKWIKDKRCLHTDALFQNKQILHNRIVFHGRYVIANKRWTFSFLAKTEKDFSDLVVISGRNWNKYFWLYSDVFMHSKERIVTVSAVSSIPKIEALSFVSLLQTLLCLCQYFELVFRCIFLQAFLLCKFYFIGGNKQLSIRFRCREQSYKGNCSNVDILISIGPMLLQVALHVVHHLNPLKFETVQDHQTSLQKRLSENPTGLHRVFPGKRTRRWSWENRFYCIM